MRGCAPMTCSGWLFTTLAKWPTRSGGQGRGQSEGALWSEAWRKSGSDREGVRKEDLEKDESSPPSLLPSHRRLPDRTSKHKILAFDIKPSSRWVLQNSPVSRTATCRPIRRPCLPRRWESTHFSICTQREGQTAARHNSPALLCSPLS